MDLAWERWLVLLCAGVSAGTLTFTIQRSFLRAAQHYQKQYTHDTEHSLRDLYMFLDVRLLWPVMLWCAVTVFLLLIWLGVGGLWSLLLSAVSLAIPGALIRNAKSRRLALFERQLPDALQSLSSTLSAGTSLVGALHMLVQYSPTPLSQEFSVIEREVRLGVSLETAIQHLMVRMPCPGVHMLGAALMVVIQTGGQMADMLAETAASLLGEQHVQQKAAALMSQGWMQAWVMGGLPVGLVLILTSMDERFWVQITETGLGQSLLACLLLMECLGMWWLRRITKQVMSG